MNGLFPQAPHTLFDLNTGPLCSSLALLSLRHLLTLSIASGTQLQAPLTSQVQTSELDRLASSQQGFTPLHGLEPIDVWIHITGFYPKDRFERSVQLQVLLDLPGSSTCGSSNFPLEMISLPGSSSS